MKAVQPENETTPLRSDDFKTRLIEGSPDCLKVLDLDGRRIAFLGGGDSVIDRAVRRSGVDWWPEEQVTMEDVARFEGVGRVDLLVCHTPPAFVYHFFELDPDPSALAVGRAWQMLGRPQVVCGHLHKPRAVGCVRVLGELEVLID